VALRCSYAGVLVAAGTGMTAWRQVTLIGQLIDQPHQLARRLPGTHRVGDEPPHRGQHTIDPSSLTYRFRTRTRQHLPTHQRIDTTGLWPGVAQPGDEQPQCRHRLAVRYNETGTSSVRSQ
jgi:hypothetical protein